MCSPLTELHNTDQQQEISPQTLPLIVKLQDLQAAFYVKLHKTKKGQK